MKKDIIKNPPGVRDKHVKSAVPGGKNRQGMGGKRIHSDTTGHVEKTAKALHGSDPYIASHKL
jgi:hypothetical protein